MKEITRIHIAKTAYDIETAAKKELEAYIAALERYAQDPEILADIEIRITELLEERGIKKDGVIATDDVAALRERLGEPQDFAEDGDIVVPPADDETKPRRRLYRDEEKAVLGGVLAGMSTYVGFNPLWARLLFIALLLGSFGTMAIVYIVLWIVMPPARTAAEKLELEGKPVTLESIRARGVLVEQAVKNTMPATVKKAGLIFAGIISIGVALGALIATAAVVVSIYAADQGYLVQGLVSGHEWVGQLALALFVTSGLTLTALGVLLAYAAFSQQFTKRFAIATVALILVGIMSFGAGIATVTAGSRYQREQLQQAIEEQKVSLGDEFATVTQLTTSAHTVSSPYGFGQEMSIEYRVDPGEPRYELRALPGVRVDVKVEDDAARFVLKSSGDQNQAFGNVSMPRLVIYGPALDEVMVEQGEFQYTAAHQQQQDLSINGLPTTTVSVYGDYGTFTVEGSSRVTAESSTIRNLVVRQQADSRVEAGVVRTLDVTQPDACPAQHDGMSSQVVVRGVSSQKLTYNGAERNAATVIRDCGVLVVGDEDDINDEYWERS